MCGSVILHIYGDNLLYKAAVFFVCLSVPPFFVDTTVGLQQNLAHIFG